MTRKINAELAREVLCYVNQGLCEGMGEAKGAGDMCVQHAVARAYGDTHYKSPEEAAAIDGIYFSTDRPTCVNSALIDLGIMLNDAPGWDSEEERAKGLRRFAVAELGTRNKFDAAGFVARASKLLQSEFLDCFEVGERVHLLSSDGDHMEYSDNFSNADLARFANRIADILEEMKTPGSEFLCMVDWSATDLSKPLPKVAE